MQIAKAQKKRSHGFKYCTKNLGKGINQSFKHLHANLDNNTQFIHHNRDNIENKIITCNKSSHERAHESKICKSKICRNLHRDHNRDKILSGHATLEDCENEIALNFLKLLKQPHYKREHFIPILLCE